MKHTQGPWHPVLHHDKRAEVIADDHPVCDVTMGEWGDTNLSFRVVRTPNHGSVAKPTVEMFAYGEVPRDEAIANLLLIAQAPNLRDICERLTQLVDHTTDDAALVDLANDAYEALWRTEHFPDAVRKEQDEQD